MSKFKIHISCFSSCFRTCGRSGACAGNGWFPSERSLGLYSVRVGRATAGLDTVGRQVSIPDHASTALDAICELLTVIAWESRRMARVQLGSSATACIILASPV